MARPHIAVNVGKAKPNHEKADAGHIRSTQPGQKIKVLKPEGREVVSLPASGIKIIVDSTGIADIHIYNQTSVPLSVTIKEGGEELLNVVKNNKTIKVPLGARAIVEV